MESPVELVENIINETLDGIFGKHLNVIHHLSKTRKLLNINWMRWLYLLLFWGLEKSCKRCVICDATQLTNTKTENKNRIRNISMRPLLTKWTQYQKSQKKPLKQMKSLLIFFFHKFFQPKVMLKLSSNKWNVPKLLPICCNQQPVQRITIGYCLFYMWCAWIYVCWDKSMPKMETIQIPIEYLKKWPKFWWFATVLVPLIIGSYLIQNRFNK